MDLARRIYSRELKIAVMREVGVDAHPAVGATIEAGERVPEVGHAAVDAEPAGAFDRRMSHVDGHVLPGGASCMTEFACGKRGRGNGCLRGGADSERRREHRVGPGELHAAQRIARQPGKLPQAGQRLARVHAVSAA